MAVAFDQIGQASQHGALWTYMWSPILLGGDARYLNGDPLIVVLEWIALFIGLFEAYAMVQFFRNGKRFTSTQLSFIMGGRSWRSRCQRSTSGWRSRTTCKDDSPVEMWIKFVALNLLWCTMPLVTYFWGVRRLVRQDLCGEVLARLLSRSLMGEAPVGSLPQGVYDLKDSCRRCLSIRQGS